MPLALLRAPRATESTMPAIVFGKLPSRPDFIRINATHPVATELDELIQNTLEHFRTQEGWEDRYDSAPILDCCYPSRDQKWIFVGSLASSRDQSGRRYPLVAGAAVPAQTLAGERRLLPIACEVFFEGLHEHLTNAIDNSVEALACRQFLESQASIWTGTQDLSLASEIVKRFLDAQHPDTLGAGLASSLPQTLLNIAFYRDFLRRFTSPSTHQIIELPLKGGRGEASLHACGWLSILAAVEGGADPWSGGFFLQQGRDQGRLCAACSRLPNESLLMALNGKIREELRLDLGSEQKPWLSHRLYPEVAYALERLLSNPDLTLSSLLAFLRDASHKIAASGTSLSAY